MRLTARLTVALIFCFAGVLVLPVVSLDTDPFSWQLFAQSYSECIQDETTLCLANDRFQIRTLWQTNQGTSGEGHAVALTADTGYFWFFSESNVEVVVKVLDGCLITNAFWVFSGGLTNVGVQISILDTETGVFKTYENPIDTEFVPIQDVFAFQTCP